ncbi:MAG: M20/M25/M40 family metallo-hydrolase [Clostridium sp.]|uniref:M28 family metallopeptidase n=1 Tax=Clostridium sp. TaxID=1506 RepID=UPI00301ED32A
MKISGKREVELLKKIGFVRTSGSKEEVMAANILADEIRSMGLEAELEAFKVPHYVIKTAKLEVLEPYKAEYTVKGYGMSGSTLEEGMECELLYIEQAEKAYLADVKDKIVLVNKMNYEVYENITKAGVKGFIAFSGTAVDEEDKTDLDERMLRPRHLQFGKILGLTLRVKDAIELVSRKATKIRFTLVQDEGETDSYNVMTTIKGTEYPKEEIHFVAHYDSVPFSTGVYDNGVGTVAIMEILRKFIEDKPKRTVKFLWFGSEERGLLGSKFYVKEHEKELENVGLAINVDMGGPVLGTNHAMVTADKGLCYMTEYLAKEVGFPMEVKQDVYSSDSTPYADSKVPSISFARFGATGAAFYHSRHDVMEFMAEEEIEKLTGFVGLFAEKIVNSMIFPVPREIPKDVVEKIDKYYGRDKDKDKEKTKENNK